MKLHSALAKEKYLSALKDRMSDHTDFGVERFTGFFLSSCFYVTHHAGYEWNRKYTNQKNAALGYVKSAENGCEVHFIRFRGAMCPAVFLPMFLIAYVCFFALFCYSGLTAEYGIGTSSLISLGIIGIPFAIAVPITTFFECMTEKSEEGRKCLISLLYDPCDPYAKLPYIP